MNEETVTISASEYDRLLEVDTKVRVEKEIDEAWDEAIEGAIQDLIDWSYRDLVAGDISVEIKAGKPGYQTVTITGLEEDEDFDYLWERIHQRHAELKADILDNPYKVWD